MKSINWREAKSSGNKYSKMIEPLMLSSDGVTCLREVRLVGCKQREWIEVIYDRDYIFEKFTFEYINRLNLSLEQLIQLVTDAWNYKNNMNSEIQG